MSLDDLGLETGATEADVLTRYKELAKAAHPDRGGSAEEFQRLQELRDKALQEVALGGSLARARLQLNALREAARGTICPRCEGSGYSMQRKVGFRTMRTVCRLCRGHGKL
jgi:DnaJ-class molecular chaperone